MVQEPHVLHLVLKERWWSMISSGLKSEEYRDLTDYWSTRLIRQEHRRQLWDDIARTGGRELIECDSIRKPFSHIRFHLGYTNITMTFELRSVYITRGNPEQGAPADRPVFCLRLGAGPVII